MSVPSLPAARVPPAFDRSTPPVPTPPQPLALPEIHASTLADGLRLRVVETPGLPVVSIALVFLAGAGADLPGEEGAAQFAAQLLEEGTRSHTSDALADTIEALGARVATWASWDASRVSMSALSPTLEQVMPLLAEMAIEPSFPADEWERAREERLAEILQERSEPGSHAAHLFARVLAPGHRFGLPQAGTPESVAALSCEAIEQVHHRLHRPSAACLAVVGDVRVDHVRALAERTFGAWTDAAVAPGSRDPGPPPPTGATHLHLVHRPGAVQSEVRVGHDAAARSTPEFFPLMVLNTVLGGCFNSRLMLNLREAHGYTYGASSRFDLRRAGGIFSAGAAVRTEVTAPALSEFLGEIRRLSEGGATAAELQYARDYLAGVFPLSLETAADVASQLLVTEIYDLPADYLHTYQARILAVSAEDVERVARTALHPDGLTMLVLGDRDRIGAEIRALGLPVTDYDEDGNVVEV